MSSITEKPQNTLVPEITRHEWEQRLKAARAKEKQLKAAGKKRPNPTKEWSSESWENLLKALRSNG